MLNAIAVSLRVGAKQRRRPMVHVSRGEWVGSGWAVFGVGGESSGANHPFLSSHGTFLQCRLNPLP
jgi:hypothetical protein